MRDDIYDNLDVTLYKPSEPNVLTMEGDIPPESISAGSFLSTVAQNVGNLQNGKVTFDNTTSGYILGVDEGVAKFYIGDSASYLNWDGTTLTVVGGLQVDEIDIGGADATSMHVDSDGNMWLGAATFASAPFKVSNAGAMTATGGTFSGSITSTSGTIGGWIIGSTTLSSAASAPNVVLDKGNNRIRVSESATEYVDLVASADNAYFRAITSSAIVANIGYTSGGTYNVLANLEIAPDIDADPGSRNYPYAAFNVVSSSPNYLQIDLYSSAVSIDTLYFDSNGKLDVPGEIAATSADINGAANIQSTLTLQAAPVPSSDYGVNLGTTSLSWNILYAAQLKGGSANDQTIDLNSEAANILINKNFVPSSDNANTSGSAGRRWSDVRTVLLNGADICFANGWILREYPLKKEDVAQSYEWMKENANEGIQLLDDNENVIAVFTRDGIYGKFKSLEELKINKN